MSPDSPEPREARSSVIIKAVVRCAHRSQAERRVRNLSAHGACIDHGGDLAPGEQITLELGGYAELRANVIWAREKVAGVRFAERIELDLARRPFRSYTAPASAAPATGWLANMHDPYKRLSR